MKPTQRGPAQPEAGEDLPGVPGAPAPTDQPAAGDAREDAEKQKQNRTHLGVDDSHRTPAMEKGKRGSFP